MDSCEHFVVIHGSWMWDIQSRLSLFVEGFAILKYQSLDFNNPLIDVSVHWFSFGCLLYDVVSVFELI